ncbi:MAG: helix-turn-helix transcriptional regulator [Candidatus Binataceae bacterium]
MNDELLKTPEAARFLKRSERTMQGWRYRNEGPRYIRLNASTVFYRVSDLIAFLDSKTVDPAGASDAA